MLDMGGSGKCLVSVLELWQTYVLLGHFLFHIITVFTLLVLGLLNALPYFGTYHTFPKI